MMDWVNISQIAALVCLVVWLWVFVSLSRELKEARNDIFKLESRTHFLEFYEGDIKKISEFRYEYAKRGDLAITELNIREEVYKKIHALQLEVAVLRAQLEERGARDI